MVKMMEETRKDGMGRQGEEIGYSGNTTSWVAPTI